MTYIGGGDELQEKYPALSVQDDQTISFVEDGKFLSSNGNRNRSRAGARNHAAAGMDSVSMGSSEGAG